jgi:5-methylcytosine-specific restriction protein A
VSRNTGPTPAERDVIYGRDSFRCVICGTADGPFAVHHRRPRGMGGTVRPGTNRPSNLVLLCDFGGCHDTGAETFRTQSYLNGWLVRQNQDPSSVPFYYRNQWVLLTDDGQVLPASEAVVLEHLGVAS